MAENEQGTFKPQFGAELNIESIIGAPLVAASKANVMMLTGQAQFLLDYCFTKEEGSDLRQPLMIEMILSQPVVDHTKQPTDPEYISINKMAFQVPLLCLLPLNSLAIDKINVDFDLEITSVGSYNYESKVNADVQLVERKAVLNGRIAPAKQEYKRNSHEQYDSTLSSRLKVNIHAGRLPLPKGLLTILDLYTKSIQPIQKIDKQSEKNKSMIDQYIPCPVCKTQIPIDLHLLVQGMQFSCPNCQAAIGLSTESRPIVNEAVDNFEKLKKLSPQKE